MKKILILAFIVSFGINIYQGFLLLDKSIQIENEAEDTIALEIGVEDLAYLFRNSSMPKEKIMELSRNQPLKEGVERVDPVLNGNRFYRFPLEITFSKSGKIEAIKIGNEAY